MMFYLTGGSSSLSKNSNIEQTDVSKSLGGYISNSLVPNGSVNSLFDMISLITLKNKQKETIAIALVNKFETIVRNVSIKLVTKEDYIGKFKVAAVNVGEDMLMEYIPNRYSEPIQAEFYDVDFHRASIKGRIVKPANVGEFITFSLFDVDAIEVFKSGIDGTMEAILKAFSHSILYKAKRISKTEFEIENLSDEIVEPEICYAVCTDDCLIEFDDKYQNTKDNTAIIADEIEPGGAIGIWLQRQIVCEKISDEELIKRFDEKVEVGELEEVELVVNYDID